MTETNDRLQDELLSSASRFAQSGLRAFLERDFAIFLLHSATALEQLTKAHLASLDESLVAASDFDSLLHACGLSGHAHRPRRLMKTITVTEALKRVGQIVPDVRNLSDELTLLVDVRNGVAHAGRVEADAVETVLVPYFKACDHVLSAMGVERGGFWGDLVEIIDTRLSDSAKEAEVRAGEAIAAARHVFKDRYSAMDEEMKKAVISMIEERYRPEKYEQDVVDCPACGYLALVSGSFDVDWVADYDREGFVENASPVVRLFPTYLRCDVCGLELDGDDELQAAGIERSRELDDVNPADFYEDWSDWDDYR